MKTKKEGWFKVAYKLYRESQTHELSFYSDNTDYLEASAFSRVYRHYNHSDFKILSIK